MLSSSVFMYSHHKQQLLMQNNIEAITKGWDTLLKYGVEIAVGVSASIIASYIYAALASGEIDPNEIPTKWEPDTFFDVYGGRHDGYECQYSIDIDDNCTVTFKKDGNRLFDQYGYEYV